MAKGGKCFIVNTVVIFCNIKKKKEKIKALQLRFTLLHVKGVCESLCVCVCVRACVRALEREHILLVILCLLLLDGICLN